MRFLGWFRRERFPDIVPPRQIFVGHDERLEMKARVRRDVADSLKRRSAAVASGSPSASVLKMARRA